MHKWEIELPPVLGATLATGLTKELGRNSWESFKFENQVQPRFTGKNSRANRFKYNVDLFARQIGRGLISRIVTGTGKHQVVTLISAAMPIHSFMVFTKIILCARNLGQDPTFEDLDQFIHPHAIQRAIQAFKTTDLQLLAKEFYAHAKQMLEIELSREVYYTMTDGGMGIWGSVELFPDCWTCKTYIPAATLDGRNAIRRQRWLEGLDFQ